MVEGPEAGSFLPPSVSEYESVSIVMRGGGLGRRSGGRRSGGGEVEGRLLQLQLNMREVEGVEEVKVGEEESHQVIMTQFSDP